MSKLIVIEGLDGCGRSTQIKMLQTCLESRGHAVVTAGIKKGTLVTEELNAAQKTNMLMPKTRSLFYATDFFDQLENNVIPSLKSGFVVLCDRYIYTLMAREIVRSVDHDWIKNLYSIARIPDKTFYLSVNHNQLIDRNLKKNSTLNYWESGMDMGLSRDIFESFSRYQELMAAEFLEMTTEYNFDIVDGNRSPEMIAIELCDKIQQTLTYENLTLQGNSLSNP